MTNLVLSWLFAGCPTLWFFFDDDLPVQPLAPALKRQDVSMVMYRVEDVVATPAQASPSLCLTTVAPRSSGEIY